MRRAATLVLTALLLGVLWLLTPLSPRGLRSHPHPAASYAEALRLVDGLAAADSMALMPGAATTLMTHGARTGRVLLLLHGLTNCPAQFDSLGRIAFASGANVLIPRLPHHGLADRMTGDLARTEAEELCAFTDRALDAAHGLGDSVTVCGLSIGGVMAAWAGQERADVDRAVVIAPMIGWANAPGPARTAALARLGGTLPNVFVWWDDKLKERVGGPKHVYPRFATRSVAACMWIGGAVRDRSAHVAPAGRSLVMITVGGDIAADNGAAAGLVNAWRAHGAREVITYEFPAALHLNHDVVDPEQMGGNPALTYPVLERFLVR
jgi:pimeloyl-ACP methyl ester carboxylesterase